MRDQAKGEREQVMAAVCLDFYWERGQNFPLLNSWHKPLGSKSNFSITSVRDVVERLLNNNQDE